MSQVTWEDLSLPIERITAGGSLRFGAGGSWAYTSVHQPIPRVYPVHTTLPRAYRAYTPRRPDKNRVYHAYTARIPRVYQHTSVYHIYQRIPAYNIYIYIYLFKATVMMLHLFWLDRRLVITASRWKPKKLCKPHCYRGGPKKSDACAHARVSVYKRKSNFAFF